MYPITLKIKGIGPFIQEQVIDFSHFKKTGKILHKEFDTCKNQLITNTELESLMEYYQIVLELSTDEILLEVKNRIENKSISLHNSIPLPLLVEELSYRAMMIDHILLKSIEQYTSD